jgi:hypothetical protein
MFSNGGIALIVEGGEWYVCVNVPVLLRYYIHINVPPQKIKKIVSSIKEKISSKPFGPNRKPVEIVANATAAGGWPLYLKTPSVVDLVFYDGSEDVFYTPVTWWNKP